MNKFLVVLIFLWASVSFTKEMTVNKVRDLKLDIYLPSIQFRYEDAADQSRSLKNGYGISLNLEINSQYLLGIEYNIQSEKSGNSSASINRDFSEVNAVAGYKLQQIQLAEGNAVSFYGMAYLGQNKSKIKTELLGLVTEDESKPELSYGLGALAQLKFKLFLIEIDTRMMSSKSYEPRTVNVTNLRVGFQIEI